MPTILAKGKEAVSSPDLTNKFTSLFWWFSSLVQGRLLMPEIGTDFPHVLNPNFAKVE
jgi:hypothetical protein